MGRGRREGVKGRRYGLYRVFSSPRWVFILVPFAGRACSGGEMADLVLVVLTAVIFTVFGLVVKAVGRL
ncbi:hypothetical protein GCM10010468_54980 [Actinocorallia longicatena]|uniref:Uncharacterized protein n=1 Tax=Actinocorallia longicatena TaxID=111803 RepID=A0ABP6QG42_9ACTN